MSTSLATYTATCKTQVNFSRSSLLTAATGDYNITVMSQAHLSGSNFDVKVVSLVWNLQDLRPRESIDPKSVPVDEQTATAHTQHDGYTLGVLRRHNHILGYHLRQWREGTVADGLSHRYVCNKDMKLFVWCRLKHSLVIAVVIRWSRGINGEFEGCQMSVTQKKLLYSGWYKVLWQNTEDCLTSNWAEDKQPMTLSTIYENRQRDRQTDREKRKRQNGKEKKGKAREREKKVCQDRERKRQEDQNKSRDLWGTFYTEIRNKRSKISLKIKDSLSRCIVQLSKDWCGTDSKINLS